MTEYKDLHITKTTFKSGRVEYYLDEAPMSDPFEEVVSEETVEVTVVFKETEDIKK